MQCQWKEAGMGRRGGTKRRQSRSRLHGAQLRKVEITTDQEAAFTNQEAELSGVSQSFQTGEACEVTTKNASDVMEEGAPKVHLIW